MKIFFLLTVLFFGSIISSDIQTNIGFLSTSDSGLSTFVVAVKNLLASSGTSNAISSVSYSITPSSNFLVYANNGQIGTIMPGATGDAMFFVASSVVDVQKSVSVTVHYTEAGNDLSNTLTFILDSSVVISKRELESNEISDISLSTRSTYLTESPTTFNALDNSQDNWESFNLYAGSTTLYTVSFSVNEPSGACVVHTAAVNSWTQITANTNKGTSFAIKGSAYSTPYTVNIVVKYKIGSTGATFTTETFPTSVTITTTKRLAYRPINAGFSGLRTDYTAGIAVAGVAVAGVVAAAIVAAVVIRRQRSTSTLSA